jgi:hypothetical protein
MEAALDISRRWNPLDTEYKAALQYMTEHKYRQALENLHLLIVKCLFEMHKLNISGTGAFLHAFCSLINLQLTQVTK